MIQDRWHCRRSRPAPLGEPRGWPYDQEKLRRQPLCIAPAYTQPDPEQRSRVACRETSAGYWSGTSGSHLRATVSRDGDGWVASSAPRTRPASHPSLPSAATPPSKRRKWRPTRCRRRCNRLGY